MNPQVNEHSTTWTHRTQATQVRLDTAEVGRERNGSDDSISTALHGTPRRGTTPQLRWHATSAGRVRWGEWYPIHTEVLTLPPPKLVVVKACT
jgi:hypothetical protein